MVKPELGGFRRRPSVFFLKGVFPVEYAETIRSVKRLLAKGRSYPMPDHKTLLWGRIETRRWVIKPMP